MGYVSEVVLLRYISHNWRGQLLGGYVVKLGFFKPRTEPASCVEPGGDSEVVKPVRLRVRSDRILTEDPHTAERKQADGVAVDPRETWPAWDEIRAAQSA